MRLYHYNYPNTKMKTSVYGQEFSFYYSFFSFKYSLFIFIITRSFSLTLFMNKIIIKHNITSGSGVFDAALAIPDYHRGLTQCSEKY